MSHLNLDVVSLTFLILCKSLESQKSIYLNQETTWLNESQIYRQGPKWPEQFLKQQYPLYSLQQQNSPLNILAKKQQVPKWPEKVLPNNKTENSQNHIPGKLQTIQPFGFLTRLTSTPNAQTTKKSLRREELHKIKNDLPIEPKELYLLHSEHEKHTTKDTIRDSMASSDREIQEGMSNMMNIFTMNLDVMFDNDRNLNVNGNDVYDDEKDTPSSESSSPITSRNNRRQLFENYPKPRRFTRLYNDTINVQDRTFRYQICDRRYLRNVCQFSIIYAFHTICERFNCSHSVIPRVWDVTKIKCDFLIKKNNPNPIWNGTYRKGKNKKKQKNSNENGPNRGIPVGRKRLLGKRTSGLKKIKNGKIDRKKGYKRTRIIKSTRKNG
ncbi:hypothetical protein O0L34_g14122 [Tuta absoluta]|nr:hypothetical protein O0L34_g14122 [Tuta absoluta]